MTNSRNGKSGSGDNPAARLGGFLGILGVALAFTYISSSGSGGTFSSQSKPVRSSAAVELPDEEDGWGSKASSSSSSAAATRARIEKARREESKRGRGSDGTPIYDPGADGGWGSSAD